jgi:excinuclease ABC subunit A
VVADADLSIRAGALSVTRASGGALLFPRVEFRFLESVGEHFGFDLDTPWKELSERGAAGRARRAPASERFEDRAQWNGRRYKGAVTWQRRYRGVLPALEEAWEKGSRRKQLERYLGERTCGDCGGSRLNAFARAVDLGGVTLPELTAMSVTDFAGRLAELRLSTREDRRRRTVGDRDPAPHRLLARGRSRVPDLGPRRGHPVGR